MVSGVIVAIAVIVGGWIGTRLFLWGARRARRAVRFGFALVTFRLLRRCPDCKSLIRADARVCKHCGYRRPPRGRRARRREARRQLAAAA
jgi:ribosomal protein L32